MIVVHFSDYHGDLGTRLPDADVYVCTGDMTPNWPSLFFMTAWDRDLVEVDYDHRFEHVNDTYCGRKLKPALEKSRQEQWIAQQNFRRECFGLASIDAPVACVRGNHDFTDLAPLFGGDVWEVSLDPSRTIELFDLKFGGVRGVMPIGSEWSDETTDNDMLEQTNKIPMDVDVLISHSPPMGVLDGYRGSHYGAQALKNYIVRREYAEYDGGKKLLAHAFGHIHEANERKDEGGTIYSNAACSHRVLEIGKKH